MRDGPILLLGVLYVKRDECPELAEGVPHPCSIWYAVLKQEPQRVELKESVYKVHL
jgi:hypothetical protein